MSDKTRMSIKQSKDICSNNNNEYDNCQGPSVSSVKLNAQKTSLSGLCHSMENINIDLRCYLSINYKIDDNSESPLLSSSQICSIDSGISESFETGISGRKEKSQIQINNEISVKKIVAQWEEKGTIIKPQSFLNKIDRPEMRYESGEKIERFKKVLEEMEKEDKIKIQKQIERELTVIFLKKELRKAKKILRKIEAQIEKQIKLKEDNRKAIEENALNDNVEFKNKNDELQNNNNNKEMEIKTDKKEKRCNDEIPDKKFTNISIIYRLKSHRFIRRLVKSFNGIMKKDRYIQF